ncbi:MAG: peptidase domain protein, partial [Glaciihabitans sp.]|nr:peptidase domain protein [Glaciihabitans sp.]
FGDVKLAGIVGLALGWVGWGALLVGAFAAFLVGAVLGLLLIAFRRGGRKTAIPFGPFMLLGAAIGVAWGEQLASGYLGLMGL